MQSGGYYACTRSSGVLKLMAECIHGGCYFRGCRCSHSGGVLVVVGVLVIVGLLITVIAVDVLVFAGVFLVVASS